MLKWLFLLFLSGTLFADCSLAIDKWLLPDHPSLSWTETPSWVQPLSYSKATAVGKDILVDLQWNLEEQQFYTHIAFPVCEPGETTVSIAFEPSFELIKVHDACIKREGIVIEGPFSKEFCLNHDEVLLITFYALQPGDLIEYAYTIEGDNPLLQGHIVEAFPPECPEQALFGRLLYKQGRKLFSTAMGELFQPEEKLLDDQWVEAIYVASDNRGIQISDFANWEEVAEWAGVLFNVQEKNGPALEPLARRFSQEQTDESKILSAIQFVKEEIESFERPLPLQKATDPETTVARGYGDNKDKALLLQQLLQRLGCKADLCLVHTDCPDLAENVHPSCFAFNHAVVKVGFNGGEFLVDPMEPFQPDALEKNAVFFEGSFLEIGRGLESIQKKWAKEKVEIDADVTVSSDYSKAVFKIVSLYKEDSADALRSHIAAYGKEGAAEILKARYEGIYDEVETIRPIKIEEDAEANTFKVHEYYSVKQTTSDKPQFVFKFLSMALFFPDLIEHNKGYATFQHPIHYRETVRIHTPLDVISEPILEEVKNRYFCFKAEWSKDKDDSLVVTHTFETYDNQVHPADKDIVLAASEQMQEHFAIEFLKPEIVNNTSIGVGTLSLRISGKLMAACLIVAFPMMRKRWKKK